MYLSGALPAGVFSENITDTFAFYFLAIDCPANNYSIIPLLRSSQLIELHALNPILSKIIFKLK